MSENGQATLKYPEADDRRGLLHRTSSGCSVEAMNKRSGDSQGVELVNRTMVLTPARDADPNSESTIIQGELRKARDVEV